MASNQERAERLYYSVLLRFGVVQSTSDREAFIAAIAREIAAARDEALSEVVTYARSQGWTGVAARVETMKSTPPPDAPRAATEALAEKVRVLEMDRAVAVASLTDSERIDALESSANAAAELRHDIEEAVDELEISLRSLGTAHDTLRDRVQFLELRLSQIAKAESV